MAKSVLLIISLISFKLFSQSVGVGGSIEVRILGQNQQFSFGPGIKFHIPLEPPFNLFSNVKFLITEFDGIAGGNSGMVTQFNFAVLLTPFNGSTNPFVSLGIVYNVNSPLKNGNTDGDFRIDNSFGYDIQTGVLFSPPGKSFSFILDLDYSSQNPGYNSTNYFTGESTGGNIDLDFLSLEFGVMYNF